MPTFKAIAQHLDQWAPPQLQESYDNSGLLVGEPDTQCTGVLVSLDVTEAIIREAQEKGCNLIVAHHPIIFGGLKQLTGQNFVTRTVMMALRHHIGIYAIHTNLDNVAHGVNKRIADTIGLTHPRILQPQKGRLKKLFVFVPHAHAEALRQALFSAGAGHIGNYDACSYNIEGTGTFRGGEGTNPFVGKQGEVHYEPETRVEVIYPAWKEKQILEAMHAAHPYEEVAYDLVLLDNSYQQAGAGMIGNLPEPMAPKAFLSHLKETMQTACIRHTALPKNPVKTIALCGGAGSFLLSQALRAKADVLVTSDFKYHQFFDADGQIMIADIGHYESEQFTIPLIGEELQENFSNFAVHLTEVNTNPIEYFT